MESYLEEEARLLAKARSKEVMDYSEDIMEYLDLHDEINNSDEGKGCGQLFLTTEGLKNPKFAKDFKMTELEYAAFIKKHIEKYPKEYFGLLLDYTGFTEGEDQVKLTEGLDYDFVVEGVSEYCIEREKFTYEECMKLWGCSI